MRRLVVTTVCFFCLAFNLMSEAANPTLNIGDAAPALTELTWLQGKPVTNYEPKHVYVVEFWATWCPPCLKAIPHLSALQKQYANKLTIVSINAEGPRGKIETIQNFMKRHGKDISYTVAMQDLVRMPMSEAWITPSGSMGIPTAGIVDAKGQLAWIGYPDRIEEYSFDEALKDTLAGHPDLTRARALQSSMSEETANYRAKSNSH